MRWLVVALLVLLPAVADALSLEEATQLAREAGVGPDIEVIIQPEPFLNGRFKAYERQIVLWLPPDVPREAALWVLYHEVGHYHQLKARGSAQGFLRAYWRQPRQLEWEADLYAAAQLCQMGVDPVEATRLALWVHASREEGPEHGTPDDRIQHVVRHHRTCPPHPTQVVTTLRQEVTK